MDSNPLELRFDPFRELGRAASPRAARAARPMPADIYRDGDTYVLALELPGIDPGTVDIDLTDQVLTVSVDRPALDSEAISWVARERWTGRLTRRFALGQAVDTDGITADYVNGMLSITVPVSEKAKPRKIAITA